MPNSKTAQELIVEIDKRGRKSRVFATAAQALILIGLGFLMTLGIRTYNRQLDTTEEINRHLDCIIVYFGQKNRTELTIDDINKCTISRGNTVQQFFTTNDKGDVKVTTEPQNETVEKPSSSTQSPQEVAQAPQPSNPTPTPSQPQNEQPGLVGGIIKDTDDLLNQLREGVLNNVIH